MKKIVLMAMMFIAAMSASAQDNEVNTTVSADVVSSYIWRGLDCGSAAIQPTLGIDYKGLSLTAWGSYGLVDTNDAKELDLTLAYATGGFNIGITDYWFNTPEERYFLYDAHKTSHIFEANVGYDFGAASIQWFTNFAGNDGLNKDGKRAYSSYVELNVPFKLATCDWTATAGAVPYATDYYGVNGFAVTNLALKATKDIKITDSFSIPVFGQIAANPASQKAYFVFGFTIQ
ncbi:hypothetical protein [Prevotella sp. MA2016]|uniref:hypothetical protein n=1 Tax=Prevotella sp. MA2016 TaxID=1408310 RepID=UPI0004915051|nr:hypothetical protein [Prevotella sp. MA2016]